MRGRRLGEPSQLAGASEGRGKEPLIEQRREKEVFKLFKRLVGPESRPRNESAGGRMGNIKVKGGCPSAGRGSEGGDVYDEKLFVVQTPPEGGVIKEGLGVFVKTLQEELDMRNKMAYDLNLMKMEMDELEAEKGDEWKRVAITEAWKHAKESVLCEVVGEMRKKVVTFRRIPICKVKDLEVHNASS